MRILFVANYLSHSGYAKQTRIIVPAIIAAGHEVEVLPIASPHINIIEHAPDGVKLLSLAQGHLGNDIVRHHYLRGGFDAVITFTDVWGIAAEVYKDMNWYPITPIDTYSLSSQHAANIRTSKFPIAISRFGQKIIEQETGIKAHYLPMMVDTDRWFPGDKAQARHALGLEQDKTMFTFIGVNHDVPSRKGIPELLQAWAGLSDELGDSAYLYMHTAKHGAVDVEAMARQLNILPHRLKIIDEAQYHIGFTDEDMLLLVQSSDCVIIPSRREGACLPLIEAQACGVPVIASDAHAQAEYNRGPYRVSGEKEWSLLGAWEFAPSVESIKEQILKVMESQDENYRIANVGIRQLDTFITLSIQAVTTEHLQPILEAISMDVLSRE